MGFGHGALHLPPTTHRDLGRPDELALAEAELSPGSLPRAIGEALEGEGDDDDWGPGSPGTRGVAGD